VNKPPALVFEPDRDSLRRQFVDAWRKRREGLPAEPLEMQVGDVVQDHPEYQPLLEEAESALGGEWTPEGGTANPFLHMALHLALRDQVATDRPPGVRRLHGRLAGRLGAHEAEHRMIDVLAESLWRAQRNKSLPDEVSYLEALERL
jgi:hypothetical protein